MKINVQKESNFGYFLFLYEIYNLYYRGGDMLSDYRFTLIMIMVLLLVLLGGGFAIIGSILGFLFN